MPFSCKGKPLEARLAAGKGLGPTHRSVLLWRPALRDVTGIVRNLFTLHVRSNYDLPASGLLILLIDRQPRGAYFVGDLGANPVKLLRWAISVLEISFVCFALIVPRVDDPATAFDEADSPVNVTAPLGARTNLVLPARHFVAIPGERRMRWKPCTSINGLTPEPGIYSSRSLLHVVCKLLC